MIVNIIMNVITIMNVIVNVITNVKTLGGGTAPFGTARWFR